jgi:hypothetical protein
MIPIAALAWFAYVLLQGAAVMNRMVSIRTEELIGAALACWR